MPSSDYWNNLWVRRLSRRAALLAGALGAGGVAAGPLIACRGREKSTSPAGKTGADFGLTGDFANARYGGTIVDSLGDLAISLDPHTSENPASHSYCQPCY